MPCRLPISLVLGASLALLFSGCGGQSDQASDPVKLQGAGASFPAPLYNKWFKAYSGSHPNALVDYQSVGSGSGVKSVTESGSSP
jgi:phosphate transport system substrate-binding protein